MLIFLVSSSYNAHWKKDKWLAHHLIFVCSPLILLTVIKKAHNLLDELILPLFFKGRQLKQTGCNSERRVHVKLYTDGQLTDSQMEAQRPRTEAHGLLGDNRKENSSISFSPSTSCSSLPHMSMRTNVHIELQDHLPCSVV